MIFATLGRVEHDTYTSQSMNSRGVEGTRSSTESVYREYSSRAAGTWHVFPLAPWCPLRDRTGRNDDVDGDAVKVKGSEEFLCKVNYTPAVEQTWEEVSTLVSGSTSRPVVEVSSAEVSGT